RCYRRAPPEGRNRRSARHVFAFGFGEQAIGSAGFGRQPFQVILRVIPGHIDDRTSSAVPFVVICTTACSLLNARIPLFERHGKLTHGELPFKINSMDRRFVWVRLRIAGGAHVEIALRNGDQPGTEVAILKGLAYFASFGGRPEDGIVGVHDVAIRTLTAQALALLARKLGEIAFEVFVGSWRCSERRAAVSVQPEASKPRKRLLRLQIDLLALDQAALTEIEGIDRTGR